MHKHILALILLCLCILFRIDKVLGQSKEPKQFDLNKSPPREDDTEMDAEQQQHTNENRNIEKYIGAKRGGVKQKDERRKAIAREKARQWRKEFRERQESGKLTKKDLESLEKAKLRKIKFNENHKEELKEYYSNYRLNHLEERTASIKRWRMENSEKVKEYEKRYRIKNPDKIRVRNLKYRLKKGRQQNLKEQNSPNQENK